MSYPVVSLPGEKYLEMNATDHSHAVSLHARSTNGHEENLFRWPHVNNSVDRPFYPPHNQYYTDKVTSSRVDFNRHFDSRYSHDLRSRHDYNPLSNDDQRMYEFHLQQQQRNAVTAADARATLPNNADIRNPNEDARSPVFKKVSETYSQSKLIFDGGHSAHEAAQKHANKTPEFRHLSNSYPNSAVTKPSTDDRFISYNSNVSNITQSNEPNLDQSLIQSTSLQLPAPVSVNEVSSKLPGSCQPRNDKSPVMSETGSAGTPLNGTSKMPPKGNSPESQEGKLPANGNALPDERVGKIATEKIITPESENEENTQDPERKLNATKNSGKKSPDDSSPDNGLPSYTAMIAQSILKQEGNKSTLSDIYEYMEQNFPSLEKRGTGWRNCVRHTLSLNDCFVKLHRPENGRSCNWAIHPSYFESFSRGDYRKRRALRKRPRALQWIDPIMLGGYPFMRDHEIHSEMEQQQSQFYHYPPAAGMWNTPQTTYNPNQSSPSHLQHFPTPPPPQPTAHSQHLPPHPSMHPSYPPHTAHPHLQSNHCTNTDCYCQFNKNGYRGVYTP